MGCLYTKFNFNFKAHFQLKSLEQNSMKQLIPTEKGGVVLSKVKVIHLVRNKFLKPYTHKNPPKLNFRSKSVKWAHVYSSKAMKKEILQLSIQSRNVIF